MGKKADRLLAELRAFGLGYPEVHGKAPWPGHDDLAVRNKTFAYLSANGEPFSVSVKLPFTGAAVRKRTYAAPTAYGLGKSGWVTLTPTDHQLPATGEWKAWLDESYRAQAPKSLSKKIRFRPE